MTQLLQHGANLGKKDSTMNSRRWLWIGIGLIVLFVSAMLYGVAFYAYQQDTLSAATYAQLEVTRIYGTIVATLAQ